MLTANTYPAEDAARVSFQTSGLIIPALHKNKGVIKSCTFTNISHRTLSIIQNATVLIINIIHQQ